ncbi:MAG: peptidylprolyl isomerase [Gammaproteobacteria bacterium]|nr:peptidylprolyl isomerase [Gammaproteobacteria bacterium]
MNIDNDCVVSIHYKLTDDEGTVIDSSEGQDPLNYLHGAQGIIPGLESALVGKEAGEALQVTVQPADGYGEINPEMVQQVPKEAFAGIDNLEAGMPLQADDGQGNIQHVMVKEVTEEGITIDANHPLAGKVLHFDVTIDNVRAATSEELDHGHVH